MCLLIFISALLKKVAVNSKGTTLTEKHLVIYYLRCKKIESSERYLKPEAVK